MLVEFFKGSVAYHYCQHFRPDDTCTRAAVLYHWARQLAMALPDFRKAAVDGFRNIQVPFELHPSMRASYEVQTGVAYAT
jgi:hypothetical protein